jgi:hypothetical protein
VPAGRIRAQAITEAVQRLVAQSSPLRAARLGKISQYLNTNARHLRWPANCKQWIAKLDCEAQGRLPEQGYWSLEVFVLEDLTTFSKDDELIVVCEWGSDAFHRRVIELENEGYSAREGSYRIAAEINPETGEVIHQHTIEMFLPQSDN